MALTTPDITVRPAAEAPARSTSLPRSRALRAFAAPLILSALALALRLHDLGRDSLWYDELASVSLGSESLPTLLSVVATLEINMALYYVLMHVWLGIVGSTPPEALVRLPSVLFGVGGVAAMYALGVALFDRRAGAASALVLAVNPFHIGWSQDARGYSLWTLLIVLSYLALTHASRAPSSRSIWAGYVVSTVLSLYIHLFTGFGIVAQGIAVLARRRRVVLVGFTLAGFAVTLLGLPLLLFALGQSDMTQLRHVPPPTWKSVMSMAEAYAGGAWLLWLYVLLGLIGMASTVRQLRLGPTNGYSALTVALWAFLPLIAVLVLSVALRPMFQERYVFLIHPAWCLLAGLGLARLRPGIAGIAVGALLLALTGSVLASGYAVHRAEDWRSAVRYLASQAEPGDGWIFISRKNRMAWDFYAPRFGLDPSNIDDIDRYTWTEWATSRANRAPAFSRAELDQFGASHPRIWLVLSHEFDAFVEQDEGGDTAAWVRDRLTRTGYAARQRIFPGIRVLLYERRR